MQAAGSVRAAAGMKHNGYMLGWMEFVKWGGYHTEPVNEGLSMGI